MGSGVVPVVSGLSIGLMCVWHGYILVGIDLLSSLDDTDR